VTCHTFRHSFPPISSSAVTTSRTIQELLGHRGVSTTMPTPTFSAMALVASQPARQF
jgi:integrase